MKTWSYKTITQKAEAEIKRFMALAETAESDSERRMYRHWAYGAFSSWNNLTTGWQSLGDAELMEALTLPDKKEAA